MSRITSYRLGTQVETTTCRVLKHKYLNNEFNLTLKLVFFKIKFQKSCGTTNKILCLCYCEQATLTSIAFMMRNTSLVG